MPYADLAGTRLHYRTDGNRARPCLVLSNSLGTDLGMWEAQAAALAADFFVVRYDTRGHGQSTCSDAALGIDQLGRDVVALLDHLDLPSAAFCGISMGGLTGQWLAIHHAHRIVKLVLANTAARIGSAEAWTTRAAQVGQDGMDGVADGAAARWFTPGFIEREPATVAHMVGTLRGQDVRGYAACCAALAQADLRPQVSAIFAKTLIIAGAQDPVTTVADGVWLQRQIAGARLLSVPASHLSNIEAATEFTGAVRAFLLG